MSARRRFTHVASMPKASSVRKRATASLGSASSVVCTDLLVVDQAPFLERALATCERLRSELHATQALLHDYETQDRTAFQQWLHRTHGSELTRLRELWDEIGDYQFILQQLSVCADRDYKEIPLLYKELMELKQQGILLSYVSSAGQGEAQADDNEWSGEWDDEKYSEVKEDPLRAFFDQVFGRQTARSRKAAGKRGAVVKKVASPLGLKACYRALAKRLHPDHSNLDDALRERRWHELQVAYRNRDLDGLLRVEAICDMEDSGLTVRLGLARLRELAAYHQSHLIPIRQALQAAERDLAFGFTVHGATAELRQGVARDLAAQSLEVKGRVTAWAQTAASVRDEVEAQLRENEIAAARAARRAEKVQSKRARK